MCQALLITKGEKELNRFFPLKIQISNSSGNNCRSPNHLVGKKNAPISV